jgi:hypothetical protein
MELVQEKIQLIAKEMQEANASPWTITKIIKELTDLSTNNETKLRKKALELLKKLDPNAGKVYETFSNMKVHTSKETLENFNRGHILTSLLKETNISRSVAEKITLEVENEIKDSKIDFLTTTLIRELVNAKLVTYGLEKIRENYTRVGDPIYEIKKKIINEPFVGEQTREYNFLLNIPKKARELHFNGTIFIEDVEGFSQRPFAYSFIAERKDTLEKTIGSIMKNLIQKRKYFYLQPSIYGASFACAGFLKNNSQIKRTTSMLSELLQIIEEDFALSLELFTSTKVEAFSEDRMAASNLSNSLLEKTDLGVVGVDSKYALKLINTKGKNFTILNNFVEEYFPLTNNLFSPTQGIDLFININLEEIKGDNEDSLLNSIEDVGKEIEKLKHSKKKLLEEKSYLKPFKTETFKTAIGLTNLFEIGKNYEGVKSIDCANKVYKKLSKTFRDDLLFGLSSEKVRARFSDQVGKEVFSQETLDFEECLSSKKCCFTGKAGSIREINELLDKKVKLIKFIGKN